MPIYEFYCPACHVIFSFYAKTVNTAAKPLCPRCGGELQRRVSSFSVADGARRRRSDVEALPLSTQRLQEGMQRLEREVTRLKDEDPAQARRMLQNFRRMTGVRFNEMFDSSGRTHTDEDQPDTEPRHCADEPERDPGLYDL